MIIIENNLCSITTKYFDFFFFFGLYYCTIEANTKGLNEHF